MTQLVLFIAWFIVAAILARISGAIIRAADERERQRDQTPP